MIPWDHAPSTEPFLSAPLDNSSSLRSRFCRRRPSRLRRIQARGRRSPPTLPTLIGPSGRSAASCDPTRPTDALPRGANPLRVVGSGDGPSVGNASRRPASGRTGDADPRHSHRRDLMGSRAHGRDAQRPRFRERARQDSRPVCATTIHRRSPSHGTDRAALAAVVWHTASTWLNSGKLIPTGRRCGAFAPMSW